MSADIWTPDKKLNASARLLSYYNWIGCQLLELEPDKIAISNTSFSRSHQTTRIVARYEAATILAATALDIEIIEMKDSEARKKVFGKGNLPKEEVYERVTNDIKYRWLEFDKGGNDQTDAYTLARSIFI